MYGAVYSELAQCQDCYRCIRECPVKAIRVSQSRAIVMQERCIACGACVAACPSGAKRVRDDIGLAAHLLETRANVIVSLAPSFVSEFEGIEPAQLIAALRRLGFSAVSETALGAQDVSARIAQDLDAESGRIFISTACPVAVDLICKFHPAWVDRLTPVYSPLLAHAGLIRKHLGADAVVFIGPCIGKKLEAEAHPERVDVALTFEDLRRWLDERGIDPAKLQPGDADRFLPHPAAEGALYPVEGGMADATRVHLRAHHEHPTRFVCLSGVSAIENALLDFPEAGKGNLFLELLACEGGCVAGPKASRRSSVASRMKILDYARETGESPRQPELSLDIAYEGHLVKEEPFTVASVEETLQRIGKRSVEDELNCGACGYDSCRDLARAILDGRAEDRMCVSNMRNLAEKKANALIRTLPFGVAIVGANLDVIECNQEFARLMGQDAMIAYESCDGLCGAKLEKFLPITQPFTDVLNSGQDIIRENVICRNQTLSLSVFTVEPHRVIGVLLLDVTETERRRQQVIQKAELVIQNLLSNVQDIAFSLGRNAAKSEGILNSIISEFSSPDGRGGKDG